MDSFEFFKALCCLEIVNRPRIIRRLGAIRFPVVTDDTGNSQPIVGENAGPSSLLTRAVADMIAPFLHRFFILPKGERKKLLRFGKTLESFHRNETVDLLQLRT